MLIDLFGVLLPIFFDILLLNAIWKSHIARLLHERFVRNLQERLLKKKMLLKSEICMQKL